jgi:hypothetical protein
MLDDHLCRATQPDGSAYRASSRFSHSGKTGEYQLIGIGLLFIPASMISCVRLGRYFLVLYSLQSIHYI